MLSLLHTSVGFAVVGAMVGKSVCRRCCLGQKASTPSCRGATARAILPTRQTTDAPLRTYTPRLIKTGDFKDERPANDSFR
jgi:hypothetical protein